MIHRTVQIQQPWALVLPSRIVRSNTGQGGSGSNPMRSFTAFCRRCLQPRWDLPFSKDCTLILAAYVRLKVSKKFARIL